MPHILLSEPINYFERIGNYEKRFKLLNDRAREEYWRKAAPGSMPMHERNDRLSYQRRLTQREEDEEEEEYCKAVGLSFQTPLDSSLPRPIRGQDTHGYSWIALSNAAEDYGCQRAAFDLNELEGVIQSGRDLYNQSIRDWVSDPSTFIEAAERWLPYSYAPSRKPRGPLWCSNVVVIKLLEHTHHRMLMWNEMGHCIRRLREKGLASRGIKARTQVQEDPMLQKEWGSLIRLAWSAVMKITEDLGDAYAGTEGYGKVVSRPRFIESSHVQEASPCKWDPKLDLMGWIGRDWFAGTLCRYCITDQFMKRKAYMQELIKDVVKLQTLCSAAQTMLDHPERTAKLPRVLQDFISEKNIALDMWWSVHSVYGDRDLKAPPPPERRRGGKRDLSVQQLFFEDKVEALGVAVTEGKAHIEEIKLICDDTLDMAKRSAAAETLLVAFNDRWRKEMEDLSGVSLDGHVAFEEDAIRHDSYQGVPPPIKTPDPYNEAFPITNDPLGQSSRTYLAGAAIQTDKIKTTKGPSATTPVSAHHVKAEVGELSQKFAASKIDEPYEVNSRQYKLLSRLFGKDTDAKGQVRWDELDKLMKRLGFRIELRGGSVVTWIPPREVGLPINVRRPHPETSIGPVQCKDLAERLRRKYGWIAESFVRRSQETTAA